MNEDEFNSRNERRQPEEKNILFKTTREEIERNFECIFNSIVIQIQNSIECNLEIAIHAYLCVVFGLRPGFSNLNDGGLLKMRREAVKFNLESGLLNFHHRY